MKEIEIKIDVNNPSLRRKLLQNDDMVRLKKYSIKDIYYDIDKPFKIDQVLRLRIFPNHGLLAYKGPRIKNDNNLIIREEIETRVENPILIDNILSSLGYVKRDIVEKFRTNYRNSYFPKTKISLDHYPFIGFYIEVEGDQEDIFGFLKRYNINNSDLSSKNCSESYLEFLRKENIVISNPRLHFTFEDEKRFLAI